MAVDIPRYITLKREEAERTAKPKPIIWTKDFRLAVIRRIAAPLRDWLGSRERRTTQSNCDAATVIHLVAFMEPKFLDNNRQNIQSALGCTLAELQRGLQNEA